jgi:DNA-binding LacI/PurR family transcriptional regulator
MGTTASSRPTLAAVAARAGVSPSTASLAFSGSGPVSDATRERVLAAARELDYGGPDPRAKSLRTGRSGIIGVVVEDRLRDAFRDPMSLAMLDGIAEEAGAAGAGLLLLADTGGQRIDVASAPMDAVILVGCSTSLDASVATLRQRGLPIVAIEADEMDGVLAIGLDNRPASRRAARYLADLGHEHVAVVTLELDDTHDARPIPDDWQRIATSHTARQRLLGVREVFPDADGWVASGSSIDAGREAGLAVLGIRDVDEPGGARRPTAVIAQSDLLAIGVLRAAAELGLRVPEDVSVVGFDGIRVDEAGGVELTTIVQPGVDKGRAAGRAAIGLIEGAEVQRVDFTSELRVGTTTGPPPDAPRS